MTQKHTLHNRVWGDVNDVTEVSNGEVFLTGSGGLFQLSAAGHVLLNFSLNSYAWFSHVMNVQTSCAQPLKPPSTRQRDDVTMSALLSAMSACIVASSTTMTAVSSIGTITRKPDPPGNLLLDAMPAHRRFSAGDTQGNSLTRDANNMSVLQVRDVSGELCELEIDCGAATLDDVIFCHGALYVVCKSKQSLMLFTAD